MTNSFVSVSFNSLIEQTFCHILADNQRLSWKPSHTWHDQHWWKIQQLTKPWQEMETAGSLWSHTTYKSTYISYTATHAHTEHSWSSIKEESNHYAKTHTSIVTQIHKKLLPALCCSLLGWYRLSFSGNVSNVSIPLPVLMHSPHWGKIQWPRR